MHSVNHVFEIACSENVRNIAAHNVFQGARHSREFRHFAEIRDKVPDLALEWLTDYENADHIPVPIYDGISKKQRTIIVPTFKELTVQHCVVEALKPMFRRGMYRHSYASIPKIKIRSGNKVRGSIQLLWDKRGAHAGKKVIEKWLRTDKRHTKYVLKMDIRKFFDSVSHDILKRKLRQSIHDEKMLDLLFTIIDVVPKGLPLGFYTSQWLSNWFLQDLDHYIKEQLGAVYYIRYMDDMVIFGSNKRKLHKMRKAIQQYLETELDLTLKDNWQVYRFVYQEYDIIDENGKKHHIQKGRDLDFMGFRFYRTRTIMRKSIMLKCTRKAKRLYWKGSITVFDARQMMSYNGWLKCTDTYNMYLKRIKPYIKFKMIKKKMSNYDKRHRKEITG